LELVHEFPDMKGFFSQEPEIYAQVWKRAWHDFLFVQQVAAPFEVDCALAYP
jgi:hypothetical protein